MRLSILSSLSTDLISTLHWIETYYKSEIGTFDIFINDKKEMQNNKNLSMWNVQDVQRNVISGKWSLRATGLS